MLIKLINEIYIQLVALVCQQRCDGNQLLAAVNLHHIESNITLHSAC